MSISKQSPEPEQQTLFAEVSSGKSADRWLVWIAALVLLALALALWNSYGPSIFLDMAAGLWALCF